MPMSLIKKLPTKARKVYELVYKKARLQGKSQKDAAILAIGVVKKSYKQTKTKKWITKSTALKSTILKSGLFNRTLKFRIPLTNTKIDSDGQRVSKELIHKVYNNNLIKTIGDVEHETVAKLEGKTNLRSQLTDLEGTNGLYILEDVILKEDDDYTELDAIVIMNKMHPLYPYMLNQNKQGNYLHASAEWKGGKTNEDETEIIDADELGWTITNSPVGDVDKVSEVIIS